MVPRPGAGVDSPGGRSGPERSRLGGASAGPWRSELSGNPKSRRPGAAGGVPGLGAGRDRLRIGLIGCGSRGSGAAVQAVRADKNCKLVALGDAFADKAEDCLGVLKASMGDSLFAEKVDVPPERRFSG